MIVTVAETGSTNADLLAAAREGLAEGSWLRAERQSGGRGRLGRVWHSAPGNLYASTLVRVGPDDPPAPGLALVAGVALEQVAGRHAPADGLRLKWPNDLMAGAAKLAGILIERTGDAVIIGFGVNLAHHPEGIGRPVTSLAALTGTAPDPGAFCAELVEAVAEWVGCWRVEGLAPVRSRWLERAHPTGTMLRALAPDGEIAGSFAGLGDDGALLLHDESGGVRHVLAGDVFLI